MTSKQYFFFGPSGAALQSDDHTNVCTRLECRQKTFISRCVETNILSNDIHVPADLFYTLVFGLKDKVRPKHPCFLNAAQARGLFSRPYPNFDGLRRY